MSSTERDASAIRDTRRDSDHLHSLLHLSVDYTALSPPQCVMSILNEEITVLLDDCLILRGALPPDRIAQTTGADCLSI